MNSTEKFFLQCISAELAIFFEPFGYDPPLLDIEDRIYLDPVAFEEFIKTLPDYRCAAEFRLASATISDYINCTEDKELQKVLRRAEEAIELISQYYYPPHANTDIQNRKLTAENNTVTPPPGNIPPELNTPWAPIVFKYLVDLEYLDAEWKPINTKRRKNQFAYIGYLLGEVFNIQDWAKTFKGFWGLEDLSQNNTLSHGHHKVIEINRAFREALNEVLIEHKGLVKRYVITTIVNLNEKDLKTNLKFNGHGR